MSDIFIRIDGRAVEYRGLKAAISKIQLLFS